jgi:hypothetical protein
LKRERWDVEEPDPNALCERAPQGQVVEDLHVNIAKGANGMSWKPTPNTTIRSPTAASKSKPSMKLELERREEIPHLGRPRQRRGAMKEHPVRGSRGEGTILRPLPTEAIRLGGKGDPVDGVPELEELDHKVYR